MPDDMTFAHPVLRWAGGKTQLLTCIKNNYPDFGKEKIDTYMEPFFGGGAVFFDIANNHQQQITTKIINDINPNLINLYRVIRDNPIELSTVLDHIQNRYLIMNSEQRQEYYYDKREEYNRLINDKVSEQDDRVHDDKSIERASLIIFLNKTCFNGLYRVNGSGKFNVSFSDYKKPKIFDAHNIRAVSNILQNTIILYGDYRHIANYVNDHSFIYCDPPYRPLTKTASFNYYDVNSFNDDSQRLVKMFVDECDVKGSKVLLSNSDPKNVDVDDDFFDDLYKDYIIDRVVARRNISSKATTRKAIQEILIKNYE